MPQVMASGHQGLLPATALEPAGVSGLGVVPSALAPGLAGPTVPAAGPRAFKTAGPRAFKTAGPIAFKTAGPIAFRAAGMGLMPAIGATALSIGLAPAAGGPFGVGLAPVADGGAPPT